MKIRYVEDVAELEEYWKRLGWELGCDPKDVVCWHAVRFSNEVQAKGSSIERQLNRQREGCQLRGWHFDNNHIIQDLAVSAYNEDNFGKNAAMGQFLDRASKGQLPAHSVIMFENVDRFSRAEIDRAESKLWGLVKSGCAVLFLSNGLLLQKGDQSDFSKKIILLFELNRAHQESKRKSMLIIGAIKAKMAAMAKGVKVNLGTWVPAWLSYSLNPGPSYYFNEKATVVRNIVKDYIALKRITSVATKLNRDKIPLLEKGYNGVGWQPSSVKRLLENAALKGTATLRGQAFAGFYPAVISDSQWNQVQALLTVKRKQGGGTVADRSINNLFPCLVHCAYCNSRMSARTAGSKTYAYYACHAHVGKVGCQNAQYLRTSAVELDFFGCFLKQSPKEVLMAQDQELQDTANSLQIEIADYTKRIQKLADLDANDLPEIREKIKAAGQLRSEAKKKLENLFSSAGRVEVAEYAWAEILGELTGIPGVISNGSIDRNALRTALSKLNAAGFELENQLKNQNTRRQLAAHMPSLIGGIILDGLNLRYAVKSLNGKVGEWRNLEPIMTALLLPGLEVKRNTMRANSQRYWDSLNSEQREDRMKHVRVGFRKMVKGLSPQKRKQLMSAARQASKAKRDAAKLSSSSQQGA